MADARSYMKKPVTPTLDGPVAVRTQLNHEVAMKERKDGLNYAPEVGVSANAYIEYSKVLFRNLAKLECIWNNGDIDLLYPGMPCKYMYLHNGEIKESLGVILFVHSMISPAQDGFTNSQYETQIKLVIMMEPLEQEYKATNELPGGSFDGGFEKL
jgi:hypothetical protein